MERKNFKKNRTFGIHPLGSVKDELKAKQAFKLRDEQLRAIRSQYDVYDHREALFKYDYNNRGVPSLKNIAANDVNQRGLPLEGLPRELQKFTAVPAVPDNASDLLEVLHADIQGYQTIYKIVDGVPTFHSSGRRINIVTAKAYDIRLKHIGREKLNQAAIRESELYKEIFK